MIKAINPNKSDYREEGFAEAPELYRKKERMQTLYHDDYG
jgi:hypothetical protein